LEDKCEADSSQLDDENLIPEDSSTI
jgi:hypothetical protein